MNDSKLAGIGYNAGAVLTRQMVRNRILADNEVIVAGQVLLQEKFPVDPNCPFFYIFSCGVEVVTDEGAMAFVTQFDFSNGGSPLSQVRTGWGNNASLDAGTDTFLAVQTGNNDGYLIFHDPVAGGCGNVLPGEDNMGFVKRWSALADVVTMTLYAYNAGTINGALTVQTGIIQQPW